MRDNYGVPRRVSSETFVGRTAELGLLEGVLERAAAGRPAFAFVGGESGVGKTRLLREFEARARALDARVLLGQCLELGGAQIPYAPLVAALRPLARGLDAAESERLPEATRNALAELLPELGGAETRADEELKARQGRLFEAILALLERLGRGGPVLLAIEDLHWADGSTRDFITFLVRSAREERLCLVVTYRSDELHRRHPLRPLLAELERATGVERITLERFDRGELDEQLAGILLQAAPEALAQRLFDRSQGNPLFTEELLAATEDGDGWMLPETLRDVLLARVERLAPATQAVVRATAVLDRPITHGLLEAVSGLAPAEVMEGAREAVAHQVLVTDSDGTYRFRHALVGEAVHSDLLPGEDTALHARVAAALERDPALLGDVSAATVAAELACHWRAAHELSRSLGASVQAGFAAKRLYAYEEAGRHFERALELWARVPDAEERAGADRAELLRLAATCAIARGEASRAVALIREALTTLDATAEPVRAALLHLRLGHLLRQAGTGRASFAAFDRAVELLPPGPSDERARVLEERARVEMLLGDYTQTLAHMPTRRRGCCACHGWPSASRPTRRDVRRRSAKPTSRHSTPLPRLSRNARKRDRASTRRVPGAPWLRQSFRDDGCCSATRPWIQGPGRRRRWHSTRSPSRSRPHTRASGRARRWSPPVTGPPRRSSCAPPPPSPRRPAPPCWAMTSRHSPAARGSTCARRRPRPSPSPTTRRSHGSASPRASSRCCCSWPRAARTARSARRCS